VAWSGLGAQVVVGASVVVEEFLVGEEASFFALCDGEHALALFGAQDHKRVFDGDKGPNTGGMGAYSPAPVVTPDLLPVIMNGVILPVVRELKRRGIVYKGVLYAGLMIGSRGINVLEFNARFGDPETEAVLPRIGGDLIPALEACIDGTLTDALVKVRPEVAATVVMAAGGYPGSYKKGTPIEGLAEAAKVPESVVFHAEAHECGPVRPLWRRAASSPRSTKPRRSVDNRPSRAVSMGSSIGTPSVVGVRPE